MPDVAGAEEGDDSDGGGCDGYSCGGCCGGVVAGAGGYRGDGDPGEAALDDPKSGTPCGFVLFARCVDCAIDDGEESLAFVGIGFCLRDVECLCDRFELPAEPVELFTHSFPSLQDAASVVDLPRVVKTNDQGARSVNGWLSMMMSRRGFSSTGGMPGGAFARSAVRGA